MNEETCVRCSMCCKFYIKCQDGEVILPSFTCKHFKDKACDIYETRECARGEAIIERGLIPVSCPYYKEGGKFRHVASKLGEFLAIKQMSNEQFTELLKNFNVAK